MKTFYDYIYVIPCFSGFWPGNIPFREKPGRLAFSLANHLAFLKNYSYIDKKKILLLLSQRGNDPRVSVEIELFVLSARLTDNIEWQLISSPNREMTIGAMWDAYKWCEEKGVSSKYFITIDDDYLINHWEERENLLDSGFTYVGQFECIRLSTELLHRQYSGYWKKGYKFASNPQPDHDLVWAHLDLPPGKRRWTDGGYYFMKFDSLPEIEKAIGRFNKAPPGEIKTVKDYCIHGISYGEVGFPVAIYSAGFTFTTLQTHSFISSGWRDFSQLHASRTPTPMLKSSPKDFIFFMDKYEKPKGFRLQPLSPFPPYKDISVFQG